MLCRLRVPQGAASRGHARGCLEQPAGYLWGHPGRPVLPIAHHSGAM